MRILLQKNWKKGDKNDIFPSNFTFLQKWLKNICLLETLKKSLKDKIFKILDIFESLEKVNKFQKGILLSSNQPKN